MLKAYYLLTKPGIIRGNALTATAGFFLASQSNFKPDLLLVMLAGLSFIIASACVFNNYIDRGIDKKMVRTHKRALVSGTISGSHALWFASVLGLAGALMLALFTNLLTLATALTGFIFYVAVYGIYKRRSVHGTLVGSISGAIPPVVGYTAVTNRLDTAAIVLFIILVCWQMPHFYAIAIYRAKDYAKAGIPVLPLVHGIRVTRLQILSYITAFTVAAVSLSLFNYLSSFYAIAALLLGISWFSTGVRGFEVQTSDRWARHMFRYSLLVISGLCIAIIVDSIV